MYKYIHIISKTATQPTKHYLAHHNGHTLLQNFQAIFLHRPIIKIYFPTFNEWCNPSFRREKVHSCSHQHLGNSLFSCNVIVGKWILNEIQNSNKFKYSEQSAVLPHGGWVPHQSVVCNLLLSPDSSSSTCSCIYVTHTESRCSSMSHFWKQLRFLPGVENTKKGGPW